jgi:16S rRNA (uracil1498-N3)-methyltransferase
MNEREPALQLTLCQCLLKSDHFEWVLQKGTELGVSKFVPVISERTVITSPEDVKGRKLERWRRVIAEAAEQSGRGRLPVLGEVVKLQAAFNGVDPHSLNLIPWEEQKEQGLGSLLRRKLKQGQTSPVNLFIGPEGGFSRDEIQAAESRGMIPVTLGKRILRAETAAITAAALVLSAAGDLG